MGYLFESEDKTLWSPSMDVGKCFLAQVRTLEALLDESSGVSDVVSDFVDIDFDKINTFLKKIAGTVNLQNCSMKLLLRGLVVHLLALLISKGLPKQVEVLYPPDWIEDARNLSQSNMESGG